MIIDLDLDLDLDSLIINVDNNTRFILYKYMNLNIPRIQKFSVFENRISLSFQEYKDDTILTDKGWIPMKCLKIGDKLLQSEKEMYKEEILI